MEAKNETSGGGTLPRQQRQTKRAVTPVKFDLPPKQPLFNTDYTAEALKQMSMYYSTPPSTSSSSLTQRQQENELIQKVEKCFIDGNTVHYRPQYVTPNYQQMMYQQHMMNQQPAYGKLYAGQTHQTQAEVHVEVHSQVEVCMVSLLKFLMTFN